MSLHLHDHDHPHAHDHTGAANHEHRPSAGESSPAGGPAVLDIGGDVGALVLYLDRSYLGHELHVRPVDSIDGSTIHTGVWERPIGDRVFIAATFMELREGHYQLLGLDGTPMRLVTIEGGRVTELALGG